MEYRAPSNNEINDVLIWLESAPNIPANILTVLKQILSVYKNLTLGAQRAKHTLNTLRKALGILPKSEKGSTEIQPLLPGIDEVTQKTIDELREKKAEAERQRRTYHDQLKKLVHPPKDPRQLEFDFGPPEEALFSWPTSDRANVASKQKVERMKEFGIDKGLRSTYDSTKRVNLEIVVTEIDYQVETVEDIYTGKKVRASMIEQGPAQFQMTWKAIANLIKMHVGFAIPMNRIELMIGQPEFSTSKMCRVFEYIATQLLPIYFVLAEKLADASILSGDDTSTKILELDEPKENSVASQIDQHLAWAAEKANGTGLKKALNVSLLIGKTEADPRSTIRFFRTHTGSVGNLMGKLLEWREPKFKSLIFQGDLSSTNLPHLDLRKKFDFKIGGCGAHARRPFWKFREDDVDLCYFMLRGFLMLSQLEKRIDLRGRTSANILKYRSRYGRMIWEALRNRCNSAITGKVMSRIPPKFGIMPRIWPTGMDLNQACNYVINNFEALTLYLSVPQLQYTNNGSERALRIEKCMLNGSKFRKTRNGRAVLDVLRTINATCTAAKIDIGEYLKYVFKNSDKLQSAPEELTPYAVALALQKSTTTSK
jgi:hypothetical protein